MKFWFLRRRMLMSLWLWASAVLIIFTCDYYNPEQESIVLQIKKHRQEKDQQFKNTDNSPLPFADKEFFTGLNYYPVDLNFRFEGPIVNYDTIIADTILDTKGNQRPAIKYGYFNFKYHLKEYRLEIFKFIRQNRNYEKYLFLGFSDLTSGEETYGGGRYIDLIENEENSYVVDFNLAYNPYCAYNANYSCPIPTSKNHLLFPLKAGEKNFKAH